MKNATALVMTAALLPLTVLSCSGDNGPASDGVGVPCTTSSDCATGLSCKYDVCMDVAPPSALTFEATDAPPVDLSVDSSFGISFGDEQITLVSKDVSFVDAFTGVNVTPNWVAAVFLDWSGSDATGDQISFILIVPGTTGSRATPGPRSLELVLDYYDPAPVALPADAQWALTGSGQNHAQVVYVDTDDQAASQAEYDPPWATVSGTVTLESIQGTLTGRGPDRMDDTGWVEATIDLSNVELTDLQGNVLLVSGRIQVRGSTDPGSMAGSTGSQ